MKNSTKSKNSLKKQPKSTRKRKIAIAISIVVFTPLLIFGIAVGSFAIWAQGVEIDKSLLPTQNALPTFYDIGGEKIAYDEDSYIAPNDVPKDLANAFIALEDKRFYTHKGYDIVRIGGAMLSNIKAGKIKEGASTITQQLVKNTHLSQERTLARKLKEIAIARKIEQNYSKDEILSMYLSVIYFGNGAYGVKSASRLYFDKDIDDLSLAECATLAGIVKNPKKYSPLSNIDDCSERRNLVLSVIKNEGYIDEKQYSNALNEKIVVTNNTSNNKSVLNEKNIVNSYLKQAIDEVCNKLNITKYQLENSGYKIYTNLDMDLQKSLYAIMCDKSQYESDDVFCQMIVCDNFNNAVSAYVSTLNYSTYRSPGSVIKPLAVYAPAIDMGMISLATPIVDEKIDFGGYSPSNFGDKYYGDTTIRQAIKKSMNSIAVKTMSYLGTENAVRYLEKFGISTQKDDENYALALGGMTKGVSILKVANAYSTFANGGCFAQNNFVNFIADNGRKIYISSNNKEQIIKKSTADIISNALLDTVKDGTAIPLSALPFEICAKTGTAQRSDGKNSDAWCASYNQNYTAIVLHGSDIGMDEKGGGYPAKQCAKVWQKISEKHKVDKCIKYSDESRFCDVDLYATSKNKCVTLASKNTPLEYRKVEIFDVIGNIPVSTYFDEINADNLHFSIAKNGSIVDIEVSDMQDIYEYKLYREDVLGNSLIYASNDTFQPSINIVDTPLQLFGYVTYTLECSLKNYPSISASKEFKIYFDNQDFNIEFEKFIP